MDGISAIASVGAGVSRVQVVQQSPKPMERGGATETSGVRAAAELLQRVLSMPDANGHDLDVVA